MATWSSLSNAAEPPRGGALRGERTVPARVPGTRRPGRWSRFALIVLFVAVPGSINLAIMALMVLLGLGRLRRHRVPRGAEGP